MAIRSGPVEARRAGRRGFTLLEILVALGVAGVAMTIAASFFLTSLSYADLSREHKVAASIAEGQLDRIVQTPGAFVWPAVATMEAGKAVEVTLRGADGEPPYATEAPYAKPLVDRRAATREMSFNSKFTWAAYATLPADPKASYVEVSVVVGWATVDKRSQSLTLTSAVAKSQLEGLS